LALALAGVEGAGARGERRPWTTTGGLHFRFHEGGGKGETNSKPHLSIIIQKELVHSKPDVKIDDDVEA
jgi:hypothetical protein